MTSIQATVAQSALTPSNAQTVGPPAAPKGKLAWLLAWIPGTSAFRVEARRELRSHRNSVIKTFDGLRSLPDAERQAVRRSVGRATVGVAKLHLLMGRALNAIQVVGALSIQFFQFVMA